MRRSSTFALTLAVTAALACKSSDSNPTEPQDSSAIDADTSVDDADASIAIVPVSAKLASRKVEVQRLMFASGEMQISGEPFAEGFLGRNLDGYDRHALPTDRYSPSGNFSGDEIVDIVGFSTAVESYEYSKYHVNMIAYQTSAGTSLAWGPVINATGNTASDEPTVRARLVTRVGLLLRAAGTEVGGFAVLPPPKDNPFNPLGFSGLHPILVPYRAFDPAMLPDDTLARGCTFDAGYGSGTGTTQVPDYECGYSSLQLSVRATQLDKTLSPGAIGLNTWKQALWTIDFSGRLHDSKNFFVEKVASTDEPNVGVEGNKVVGLDDTGKPTAEGTYLGSTPLEGMWGLLQIDEMDNGAAYLLGSLTTNDAKTTSGFATLKDALAYDYTSAPRWWPNAITVTEGAPAEWPSPATLAIGDATSRSEDLAGLLLGYSLFFGMTDARNAGIGGKIGLKLTFDGNPYPSDDGVPNGEATAHDRALALLRVAFVDLDRLHTFPGTQIVTDTASPLASGPDAHGSKVTTTSLAHVTIALRQTLLSLNGAITQYGGADPNPKLDDKGILNGIDIHPPGAGTPTFSARVRSVLVAQATFVRDVLTRADGTVANGATFGVDGKPTVDTTPTMLESQTAAIRALLEGFLATGDKTFVDRAQAVFRTLDASFWYAPARLYRGVSAGSNAVAMTPERFGFLQSALRETHKIAHVPGDPVLSRTTLEARIARVNKLFLNGWDDVNGDSKVDKATECLAARMQLGEQALTGEYGTDDKGALTGDRDGDCVTSITFAKSGSLLAGEVDFSATK